MKGPAFRLVFRGDYSFDYDLGEVKQKISALLKVDQSKVDKLFAGNTVTLKSGLSHDDALRLKTTFDKTGGISYVEPMPEVKEPIVSWSSPAEEPTPKTPTPIPPPAQEMRKPFACPKCGFEQERSPSCVQCGVFFHKIAASAENRKGETDDKVVSSSGPAMDVQEECKWGMACHLAALSGYLIPFGNVIGPLVVWICKKNESEFVNEHGKTALNFQLTVTIFIFVSLLLSVLNAFLLMIVIPVIVILSIYSLVMVITSGIKANNGEYVDIPLSAKIIK